jgi:hypothetical protein
MFNSGPESICEKGSLDVIHSVLTKSHLKELDDR